MGMSKISPKLAHIETVLLGIRRVKDHFKNLVSNNIFLTGQLLKEEKGKVGWRGGGGGGIIDLNVRFLHEKK